MTITQQIITIAMCVIGTTATRFLPFIIFSEKKPTPKFIQYMGKWLPSAVFGMLVVYCLKNVTPLSGNHGIPELISVAITVLLHKYKRKMILSIAGGTACYMLLLHIF